MRIWCSLETLDGLKDDNVNMSYMYVEECFNIPKDEQFEIIDSNSKIKCFNNLIEIISCPGHDSGCLSYVIENKIFTGDSYVPFAPVTYNWHRCDKDMAILNENNIKNLIITKGLEVFPGHYQ